MDAKGNLPLTFTHADTSEGPLPEAVIEKPSEIPYARLVLLVSAHPRRLGLIPRNLEHHNVTLNGTSVDGDCRMGNVFGQVG